MVMRQNRAWTNKTTISSKISLIKTAAMAFIRRSNQCNRLTNKLSITKTKEWQWPIPNWLNNIKVTYSSNKMLMQSSKTTFSTKKLKHSKNSRMALTQRRLKHRNRLSKSTRLHKLKNSRMIKQRAKSNKHNLRMLKNREKSKFSTNLKKWISRWHKRLDFHPLSKKAMHHQTSFPQWLIVLHSIRQSWTIWTTCRWLVSIWSLPVQWVLVRWVSLWWLMVLVK